jgi:pimeloyl-ACP methyl ester carboxylesterase
MPPAPHLALASDGSHIAWTSRGHGAPPVLLTDGIGCAGYIWRHLAPELARSRRVLHWNYRGHGRSDPPRDLADATMEACVDDLLRVLDASGEERAVLAGHSMGVQVVLEAHRRAPARVAGLVLVCGAPGHVLDTFHDSRLLKTVFPAARALFDRWPELASSGFRAVVKSEVAMEYALAFEVNRSLVHREDLVRYFDDLSHVSSPVFVRLLESASAHDATDHLSEIRVPTLVVAGERDGFTPMRLSVRMHEAIPGSELLVLPGGTHVGPLEHPVLLGGTVRRFLAERVPVVAGSRPARRRPARKPGPSRKPTPARKPAGSKVRQPAARRPRARVRPRRRR